MSYLPSGMQHPAAEGSADLLLPQTGDCATEPGRQVCPACHRVCPAPEGGRKLPFLELFQGCGGLFPPAQPLDCIGVPGCEGTRKAAMAGA